MLVFLSLPLEAGVLPSTAVLVSAPLVIAVGGGLDGEELERGKRLGLWCNRGAGKFDFLSMDSRVRSKRRKRASARMRIASKSRVLESSLTDNELVNGSIENIIREEKCHTIFQHLVELLEVIHNNAPVFVKDS